MRGDNEMFFNPRAKRRGGESYHGGKFCRPGSFLAPKVNSTVPRILDLHFADSQNNYRMYLLSDNLSKQRKDPIFGRLSMSPI